MNNKTFNEIFQMYFNGYSVMCKKYPKAARKRRIRKKWRKRFGPDLEELMREKHWDLICYGTATMTEEEIRTWMQSKPIKFPKI